MSLWSAQRQYIKGGYEEGLESLAQERPMTAVYLICGEDELKRETAIKRLNTRFEKMGDLCFNSDTLSGANATVEAIINYRLVIVKDAEKIAAAEIDPLLDYIAAPNSSTVLVLVASKLAKNTRFYKAVSKNFPKSIVDCTPKSKRELPALVANMAKVYGVTIDQAAAEMLISYVGESTVRLDSELEKMAIAQNRQGVIGQETVARMVTRSAQAKPWELCDAFSARNAVLCEQILQRFEGQSPFGLLALCLTRVRDLIATKALEERRDAASLAKVLGRPDWQVRNYRSWAARFSAEELRCALKKAADVERSMKSGADADFVFEQWVLSLCRKSTPFA